MGEVTILFFYVTSGLVSAVILGMVCYRLAGAKGRDTVGWLLVGFIWSFSAIMMSGLVALVLHKAWAGPLWAYGAGFVVSLASPLILSVLPAIEAPGFTKRCPGCDEIVRWEADRCRACGKELSVTEVDARIKVKRPLRWCIVWAMVFLLLLAVVFGFIGYYCVPNEPRSHSTSMEHGHITQVVFCGQA